MCERNALMKLKYEYSFQKYDNRYLAIVDFTETETERRMIWVNESGKLMLEQLNEEITREALIKAVKAHYAGDDAVIEAAVDSFIAQLSEAGLLYD